MTLKKPKKGSVAWLDLQEVTGVEDYKGGQVGLKYVGGKAAKEWELNSLALMMLEKKRVADLRREYTKEAAPEFFHEDFGTDQYVRDNLDLAVKIAQEVIAGFKNVEGLNCENHPDEIEDFVCSLSQESRHLLINKARKMQGLTVEHIFTEGPRDVASK